MPRPFTRDQAMENQAFLRELRRTGNARAAARVLGIHRAKMTRRRNKDAAFAADWDAALALAHAALADPPGAARAAAEPHVVRRANGRLQLRRVQPRQLSRAAEQAFLAALGATANVRLSARAAGFTHAAFYARRRADPAFAREWRFALQQGYAALEDALHASVDPDSFERDGWRHNEPPPMPPMSPAQALQLLYLHQKEARLLDEPPHLKRRRGEPREAWLYRLAAMYEVGQQRLRDEFTIAEAERRANGRPSPFGPRAPVLPALDQVTGWSRADPAAAAHHPERALFGGWRLADWELRDGRGRRGDD